MKKYRYIQMYYLLYVIVIIFALGTIIIFKNLFVIILDSVCIGISLIDIINKSMSSIYIDNTTIIQSGIHRKKIMYFSEIERIIKLPTSKGKKIFYNCITITNLFF
ncbi:hypothetical protein B0P06_001691 [Clostridium saccharoperbutylacetonicum]|uniref:Uncharacterized protein n=1 Tax=Clostridium saccharoperbutylacetonicum N1-4(HMT) TaxID=931276 RepID=M1MRQ5_9CLOT|nr:hypothetical protein [Clostridium saccharoperbutylacetonicum]AGF54242.1 hypothetical protein Cspa_c04240 [Clostridium saccharoperbutylacetonicum N1-4(HMT)]NRT59242.1 hypothetical protein [Clostridium saccharoperbutylacetonicum]NSB28432.1 hypothetical protein [Clostridium saccharoperbutylacetonicum]NSB41920.1 hypothetical protein [Clostridium saccharoperbutylacetonicum]